MKYSFDIVILILKIFWGKSVKATYCNKSLYGCIYLCVYQLKV